MSEQTLSRDEQIQKLGELIKDIRIAMLTTALPDGSLRSRPMATQETRFDGTLWFFTQSDAGKVHEIEDDTHVNISYADPKSQTYVSVSGRARVNRDRAKIKELWSAPLRAWFPDGSDDPQIALLQVEVETAEYWDSSSSAMVHLIGMVKAVTTGQSYEPGENEKISL
jgi:general stress protein 26